MKKIPFAEVAVKIEIVKKIEETIERATKIDYD